MTSVTITTPRLELIAATADVARAEINDRARFAGLLNVAYPATWPPPLNDETTMAYMLDYLEKNPDAVGFGLWYVILPAPGQRYLIGNGGLKGRPVSGAVEIGYSLLEQYQGQGYGTEVVAGLVRWAFTHPEITCVLAETLPELLPSIRVLEKNGFQFIGEGSEPGVIRYELARGA